MTFQALALSVNPSAEFLSPLLFTCKTCRDDIWRNCLYLRLHFKTLVVFSDSCPFEHGGKTVGLRGNLNLSCFHFLFLCDSLNDILLVWGLKWDIHLATAWAKIFGHEKRGIVPRVNLNAIGKNNYDISVPISVQSHDYSAKHAFESLWRLALKQIASNKLTDYNQVRISHLHERLPRIDSH